MSSIDVQIAKGRIKFIYKGEDLSDEVDQILSGERILSLRNQVNHPAWKNNMKDSVRDVLNQASASQPIAYIDTSLGRFGLDKVTPGILISTSNEANSEANRVDKVVVTTEKQEVSHAFIEEVDQFTNFRERRSKLATGVTNGEVTFHECFKRESWPHHPIMDHLKKQVGKTIGEMLLKSDFRGDPLDLTYQTLFRSTTFPMAEIFNNGQELELYARRMGAFKDWKNILSLDPNIVEKFEINGEVVIPIIEEQKLIINHRITSTSLPVEDILGRKGIFGEQGWQLLKADRDIWAIKSAEDRIGGVVSDQKSVSFRPVDINLAKEFHRVFHYIHTPRAQIAFGMFLENEELPFSIVAFDAIDREYKKDTLLMHGYDPRKCFDLARLYSRPGTPFNTSSTIFSSAFGYFREQGLDVQAVLSAFMPTYAHGMSMISAGFNDGVLIKKGGHLFGKKEIDGKIVFEHLTKRRGDEAVETVESIWPLLPVMELMAPIQKPRFLPFEGVNEKMVAINC